MRRLQLELVRHSTRFGLAMLATAAAATTVVPVATQDLADSSEVVVTGVVARIIHTELADGRIVTRVSITVDETWKGEDRSVLELVESGGFVGDRGELIYGAPSYRVGEEVVVYASRSRLGWRTNHMLQGKFGVETDSDGTLFASREIGEGVSVMARTSGAWRATIPLAELRATAQGSTAARAELSAVSFEPLEIVGEVVSEFSTQEGSPRFFEADDGEPLIFLIDDRGDSILGLEVSRRAVDDAFTAWNDVSGTSLFLVDGGLTNDIGPEPVDGVHRVFFDDPNGDIPPPTNCAGTLGQGGSRLTFSETKTFDGRTFNRITSAFLRFADGWNGCEEWTECNFSEVAGHEVGHAFGMGHSSINPNEGDAELRDALMYFRAHFDDRCADPRADDIAGIRTFYPADAPVSVATTSPLPQAVINEPYRVELQAANATPPLTWASVGNGCPLVTDIPNLSLSSTGVIEGDIGNFGNPFDSCFTIQLTDGNGDVHEKRLQIAVVSEPSPDTPTPSPTIPIPTPTPPPTDTRVPDTATPTQTPTNTIPVDRPCVGDCNGDGQLSINELIRGVNIALDRADLSTCPSFDRNNDGQVAINELIAAVTAALFGCTN